MPTVGEAALLNLDLTVLIIQLALLAAGAGFFIVIGRRLPRDSVKNPGPETESRLARLFDVVLVAVWFGLATGAIHVSLMLVNRYVRNRFLMVGPQMIWMTPVANAAIFGVLGVLLGAFAALRPRAPVRRLSVPIFAGLGVFSLLLPFPQLHELAILLLAIAVGGQAGRWMAPCMDSWLALMRRAIVRAAVILVAVASLTAGWRIASERYAMSRIPDARAGAPNVLIVVMDTVRASSLSLYGYGRPTTPNLERWAQEGIVFDRALSTGPWTLKSHGTMFSGLYPGEFAGDFERPVSFPRPVLAEVLRDHGYLTGGFVANLLYTSGESGLNRGFVHYDDYRVSLRQVPLHSWIPHATFLVNLAHSRSLGDMWNTIVHPTLELDFRDFNHRTYERRTAGEINDAFLEWQAANSGRPFFAFLNYFDAHPYESPQEFRRKFALPGQVSKGLYDGAIAYIDHEIDRLLTELRKRKLLDNTIVVITADHGEQFGEHGLAYHGNSLYLPLLQVPLILRYPPAVPAGGRTPAPVTLRDVASTIAELAGLPASTFPGESLSSHWSDDRPGPTSSPLLADLERAIRPRPNSPAIYGPMRSIFDTEYHYILRGDGEEQLFDYRTDPEELTDLRSTEIGRQKLQELRRRLLPSSAWASKR